MGNSRGALAATLSFLIWGAVPIYWKQLQEVAASELMAHRIIWSVLLLFGVLAWRKAFAELTPAFTSTRVFLNTLLASMLLAVNWMVYIWAVNSGHIIEASLGYFLTPIFNIAFGFVFLHERLRTLQWTAIACAAVGVLLLLLHAGYVPWIALTLSTSWALYGILKRHSLLGSIAGLTVESLILLPFAIGFVLWKLHAGEGAFGHASIGLHLLLLGLGVTTSIPLLLFAYGAQRIRFVTLGLLQYIAPTIQFLIGMFLYSEPISAARLQAFTFIWIGLALYTADGFWTQRGRLLAATR